MNLFMKYLTTILTAVFILASAEAVLAQTQGDYLVSEATVGDGVAAYSLQNYERAAEIWLSLAENGSADAAFRLAQLYDLGLGVEHNPQEAAKWLEQAATSDHVDAQYMLAGMYSSGRGIAQDQIKATEFYKMASENGHPKAQYQLASIYYLGQGVEVDNINAVFWFAKAKDGLNDGSEKEIASQVFDRLFEALSDEQKRDLLKRIAFSHNSSK